MWHNFPPAVYGVICLALAASYARRRQPLGWAAMAFAAGFLALAAYVGFALPFHSVVAATGTVAYVGAVALVRPDEPLTHTGFAYSAFVAPGVLGWAIGFALLELHPDYAGDAGLPWLAVGAFVVVGGYNLLLCLGSIALGTRALSNRQSVAVELRAAWLYFASLLLMAR